MGWLEMSHRVISSQRFFEKAAGSCATRQGTTGAYTSLMKSLDARFLVGLLVALAPLSAACGAPSSEGDDSVASSESNLGSDPTIPELPAPGGTGDLTPWGGADSSKWRPEAIVANAGSRAMNDAWSRTDVADVVVAIPMKLWSSGFFEFGDGQANARPDFVNWQGQPRPPVVASVIKFKNAPTTLSVRFDRALPYNGTAFELHFNATTMPLTATRDAQGDAVVEIPLPVGLTFDDLLSQQAAIVHPTGWADWFPIYFRTGVKKISDLRASQTKFSDGRSIVDREQVTSVGASDGKSARERLSSHWFGFGYNGASGNVQPFQPGSIHATYPFYGKNITTAVGQGWTWVADERPGGFKVMYTCFERRRLDLEVSAPDGGVPSGGGWHQINDAAETILNDLENGPLMVAAGRNNPWLETQLPSGVFSYGLTDVATFRWLRPGEAFITTKGNWADDGKGKWFEQSNYHWYFFQQNKDVCTEEIVNAPGQIPQSFDL
jgi:hypothetical protein